MTGYIKRKILSGDSAHGSDDKRMSVFQGFIVKLGSFITFVFSDSAIGAATAKSLDDCLHEIREITRTAREVKPDVIILIHGGPIAEAEDAQYVLERAEGVAGFYGASSMERLPVEVALREATKQFKSLYLAASKLPV